MSRKPSKPNQRLQKNPQVIVQLSSIQSCLLPIYLSLFTFTYTATHQGNETTNTERQTASVIDQKSHQATNPSTLKLVNAVDPLINGPSYVRESALPNPIAQNYIVPIAVTKKSTLHIQHNAKTLQPENSDSDQPNSLPPFENQSYEGESSSSSSSSLLTSSSHALRTLHQTSSNDPNLNLSSITVPAQNLSPSEIGDRSEKSEFEPAKSVQVAINQKSEKEDEEKVQKPELEDDKLDEEIKPVKEIIVKRKPKLQKVETFESANELTPSPLVSDQPNRGIVNALFSASFVAASVLQAQTGEHDEFDQERKQSLGNGMQVQNPGTAKIDRSHRLSTANSFDSNHSKHSEDLSEHININKDEGLSQAPRDSSHSTKDESSKMMEDQKADRFGKTTREDNGKLKSPSPMTSIQEQPTSAESVGSLAGIAEYPNASQASFITSQNDSTTNQGKVIDSASGGGNEPFRPTTALEGVSRRRKFSEEFKARAQDREKRVSRLEEIRQMERDLEPNKRSEEGMDERDIPPEAEARSCSKHSRCHCYLFSIPNAFRMYGMIS